MLQVENWSIFTDQIMCIHHEGKDPTQIRLAYFRQLATQRALL